jgi:hypothetical protein
MYGLPEKLSSHKGVSLFQSTVRDKEKNVSKKFKQVAVEQV